MNNTHPQTTNDMVFANSNSEQQIKAILSRYLPFPSNGKNALCLFGTYGTGKTTYSEIFCREFELAVSNSELKEPPFFVSCQKTQPIDKILKTSENMTGRMSFNESEYHYLIFDEVDNLTDSAQKALKAFLNRTNIVCVLTTNYLNQLDKGLQNRCHHVNFNAGPYAAIRARVKHLLQGDGLHLDDNQIDQVIDKSKGSWRDILPMAYYLAQQQSNTPKPPLSVIK